MVTSKSIGRIYRQPKNYSEVRIYKILAKVDMGYIKQSATFVTYYKGVGVSENKTSFYKIREIEKLCQQLRGD